MACSISMKRAWSTANLKPVTSWCREANPPHDFGLTRVLKPSENVSELAGTPLYMPPEHSEASTHPLRLWAVGMLLHELLTGALPYPDREFYASLLEITSEAPVPLPIG